ncbi:MAG: 30S ribosomal protein S14 [Gammaproteobacteria bacterium]|nr:30S ribosomal protein S14 [Gammaproteobacteria bacterium]CAJ2376155.1 MAG: 30S ribosomal subunit protein S14 [Arenicellales bacterium IbO2]MDA7962426.1 30S ribosomal protein S14 [Gammaproteobacteria bacterium]MDA7968446.1 30S ribosomal protein S14 [Gammaproteobacteria bacterium]MDA7970737.1 30S ribosomal protein S14 [Gammaproteobacteria bacterium]
MARKSNVAREQKRRRLSAKHAEKRARLAKIVSDANASAKEQWEAMVQLQKMPRDSSRSRQRNRCALTGRPRGYSRKFGLCHNKLREVIMRGEAPGVVKSSW